MQIDVLLCNIYKIDTIRRVLREDFFYAKYETFCNGLHSHNILCAQPCNYHSLLGKYTHQR